MEEKKNEESVAEVQTGYRQQSGRSTCIVCGITRNTKSQMVKHMEQHKEDGEFVPAGQKHCGLTAFPDCPFQCYSNEELMKHIETDHKKRRCNFCSQTFETKEGLDKHRRKDHPSFKPCINMSDCSYGTGCHYSHEPLKKAFRCYQCGEEFNKSKEMMEHRKKDHEVEDCRSFLKDGKCRYKDTCWWAHPFEAEGFWDAPQSPTPPNRWNTTQSQNIPVKNVERSTKKEELMMNMMNVMNQLMTQLMNMNK